MTRPLSIQRARTEAFYDAWTERFVDAFGTTLQAGFLKMDADAREDPAVSACLLAGRAGVRDGQRVLDAGCGVAGPAVAIASAHPHCAIAGVTISAVQVRVASRVIDAAGLGGRVAVVRGDYHDLAYATDAFDVALFLESCGYSPDRPRLFAEAARVVRPGGHIYVKDVCAPDGVLTEGQSRDLRRFDEIWQLASTPTLEDVSEALTAAGCEVLRRGEIPHVSNAAFAAAMVEPDPKSFLRLNEFGRRFVMRSSDLPLFFGEVLARVD